MRTISLRPRCSANNRRGTRGRSQGTLVAASVHVFASSVERLRRAATCLKAFSYRRLEGAHPGRSSLAVDPRTGR